MSNAHGQHLRDSALRVMISGGGTGGHIFPAIAIANAVRERESATQFLFVGAEGKMEMEKVPAAGYAIEGLPIRGFQRGSIMKNLALPWRVLRSMMKARKLVRTFKPHVAVGVGGYASGPLLAAAQRMHVPTLIQEQNSFPGKTNIYLGKRVDRVCVAYTGMERFFPKEKVLFTGNPVRQDVVRLTGKRPRGMEFFGLAEGRPVVFITGGSLGARGINHGVKAALAEWKAAGTQVIWQTGKHFHEAAKEAVSALDYADCKVHEFVARMDLAYAVADLVVARAGAISVSELCLVQKPAVLVPLPTAAEDHQTYNARALTDIGAAVLLRDADTVAQLGPLVTKLLADRDYLDHLSTRIADLGIGNAAEMIAAEVIRLGYRTMERKPTPAIA
ncbi:MAG: undecaprenyldiphospho-muramoylpentapeptide beta-N-acetylglucosaminyltransferase [Flavobacteriales bacterium]|nr:undecaprenyldiphospho-muramoylpentapeptide beta-N-acetylglucosaminyltransferase [Flavobacteriales bacterium]